MKIEIAARFKPFSHVPGASCAIPGSCWIVEAFPTLLRFGGGEAELHLQLTGPVSEFTLQQDLEKNCVWVFGKAQEGFYRLRIEATDAGVDLFAEKVPPRGLGYSGWAEGVLKAKESLSILAEIPFKQYEPIERLSLGMHRDQEWERVKSRADLKEWMPILFHLGQKLPHISPQPLKGTARLLEMPKDRNAIAPALEAFFKAAFTGILVPRIRDDQYQGLAPDEPNGGDPFFLIQEGAKIIRSLFFQQTDRRLKLLPSLPIPLDRGRMTQIIASGVGEIDLEWSKKQLRQVVVRATTSGEVILDLPAEINDFRLRANRKEKGKKRGAKEPLLLVAGNTYFLDRFQK